MSINITHTDDHYVKDMVRVAADDDFDDNDHD